MPRESKSNHSHCVCGSNRPTAACCGRYLTGRAHDSARPLTAQALMRSRYAGFAAQDRTYLAATWHPSTRPQQIRVATHREWLGLRIINCQLGGETDDSGVVEFIARYRDHKMPETVPGPTEALHEISQFVRENGHWYYLVGRQVG